MVVKTRFRRGAGVVELARLESVCAGNRTVGSNPTLSASPLSVRYFNPMSETILVAEDQQHIRALIEYKLKNSGYNVVAVEDGVAALAKAREILPTLILLDVMMPLMTGFEVLSALKQDQSTKNIPILLVTAQSKEDEVLKGLELGAEDYITKPFSPNELAARVKKVLLRHGMK